MESIQIKYYIYIIFHNGSGIFFLNLLNPIQWIRESVNTYPYFSIHNFSTLRSYDIKFLFLPCSLSNVKKRRYLIFLDVINLNVTMNTMQIFFVLINFLTESHRLRRELTVELHLKNEREKENQKGGGRRRRWKKDK